MGNSLTSQTGTGLFVGSNSPVIVTPVLGSASATSLKLSNLGLLDANNNEMVLFGATANSVNYFGMTNAATTGAPAFQALGSDTNIALLLAGKGTGGVIVQGVSDGSNASSGIVREVISNSASAIAMTNDVALNVTSVLLTPGDWDVMPSVFVSPGGTLSAVFAGLNTTSATLGAIPTYSVIEATLVNAFAIAPPTLKFNVIANTTVYLVATATFTVSANVYGSIYARRR